ncbi:hypothetical protein D8868_09150 [Streptococcus oralis]|nr:hypothetical protein D8868_09150 [Streptococcus oralis]
MTWSESHFTFLDLTLKAFCLITCTSRCYFRKLWTVGCSDWGAILIYTFDCDWIWVSYKLFIWSEGHTSVWRNCVGSLTWNRLLFASICEGWLNCFIDWNQWIATLEGWGTSLWNTLRACARCVSSCRCHFSHCWFIMCSVRNTVRIIYLDSNWVWSTDKIFVRFESDLTSVRV